MPNVPKALSFPPFLRAAFIFLVLLAPSPRAALADGLVTRVEVTSLTRDVAGVWVRARLGSVPPGSPLRFEGVFRVGGAVVVFRPPGRATVLRGPSGAEVVFALDVELARLPASLLPLAAGKRMAVELSGTLGGKPVRARGDLRPKPPDVIFPSASSAFFARFTGARVFGLALDRAAGEASLAVFNPAGFDVGVEEIRWELKVGGRTLATGSRRGVRLHARRENDVRLPFSVRHGDLLAAAGEAVRKGGVVRGRLSGAVTVKAGTGRVAVPLDGAGEVRMVP